MNCRNLFNLIFAVLTLGGCISNAYAMSTGSKTPLTNSHKASTISGNRNLSHVFLIILENHSYDEIINKKSDAPYINAMAKRFDLASHYHSIGHPSLANYMEIIGGSNFGIDDSHHPNWGSAINTKHRYGFIPAHGVDVGSRGGGTGFIGKTIADQLVMAGMTWKTYQESLPIPGGYKVDFSDGKSINRGHGLYMAKHNPFEYFRSTQGSKDIVGYTSDLDRKAIGGKLKRDLAAGTVANFNFIVPNLCHDMHGKYKLCSQRHALIRDGDKEVQTLVDSITASAMWKMGKNAIIVVWDESGNNRVPLIVETNYQSKGIHSSLPYNHFSLLKTLEKRFGLPYLNHANDPQVHTMSDVFASR